MAKETTHETERQPSEREKISDNIVTNKSLISKMYKQLMQLNIKNKQCNQKMTNDLNTYFSKEDLQMASECVLSCSGVSNSLQPQGPEFFNFFLILSILSLLKKGKFTCPTGPARKSFLSLPCLAA